MPESLAMQYPPRLHNDLYPFIYPKKFQGSLQNKVTIITGKGFACCDCALVPCIDTEVGSAGTIGKALAECFAVAGARLVLVYNRTRPPPEFEERCRSLGARGVTLSQCNVADLKACKSLVQKVSNSQ
jgi:hypothetical protein